MYARPPAEAKTAQGNLIASSSDRFKFLKTHQERSRPPPNPCLRNITANPSKLLRSKLRGIHSGTIFLGATAPKSLLPRLPSLSSHSGALEDHQPRDPLNLGPTYIWFSVFDNFLKGSSALYLREIGVVVSISLVVSLVVPLLMYTIRSLRPLPPLTVIAPV